MFSSGPPLKKLRQSALTSFLPTVTTSSTPVTSATISATLLESETTSLPTVPNSEIHQETLPSEPFQPRDFNFPKKHYGDKKVSDRPFIPTWFDTWKFLHYVPEKDVVYCFDCLRAHHLNLLRKTERKDSAFAVSGFGNWKKATTEFPKHASSEQHQEALEKLCFLKQPSVITKLNEKLAQEQATAQRFLKVIFSSIKFLGKSGLALRGHDHKSGNFSELVRERVLCENDEELSRWMNRRDNWMSDTVQNEILNDLAGTLKGQIVRDILSCEYIGLQADGTTDIAGNEQFSMVIRYTDKKNGKSRRIPWVL